MEGQGAAGGPTAGRDMLGQDKDLEDLKSEPDALRADEATDILSLNPLCLVNYRQYLYH